MKLSLQTWNSHNINDGTVFKAYVLRGQLTNIQTNVVLVNRAGDYPALSGIVKVGSTITIGVTIAAGQDINTKREVLKGYFFGDDDRHDLVAYDTNDSNRPYFRRGFAVRMVEENNAPNSFFITIQTEYPYWRLVTAASTTWAVTASGDTKVIANGGNLLALPVFTITPNTTKSAGLTYRRYVPIYNNLDKSWSGPIDITDGGLDTAALTTAKMQADGDDFRAWMDGSFVDRWLSGMDTTTTKCWINLSLGARLEGTVSTTVDTDDDILYFDPTKANLDFLTALAKTTNRTLLIESEAVVFDPASIDLIAYKITDIIRGAKDSTAASHTAPFTARYIEHDLWILYGDSALAAREQDERNKPIMDLTSTNEVWSFTNYYDTASPRPGAWKGELQKSATKLSYPFTAPYNTFTDTSTVLGLAEVSSIDFTAPHENAVITWSISHPSGITAVTYSGDKYKTGSWPGIVGLQYLQPNTAWFTAFLEAAPDSTYAWEELGPNTVSLGGTYNSVRFVVDGVLSSAISEMALVQFDTVSLTFASANLPTIGLGPETSINFFDIKLTNTTTGDYLQASTPCPVGDDFVIDCEAKTAYLEDGRQVPVSLSSNRPAWMTLSAGNNTLSYTDVGTVDVTVVVSHRDRNL